MINIPHTGATTSVILRLRQICNLTDPYYLFEITNVNSRSTFYMTADDISLAPGLYQEFEFRNGVNGLTQGQFIGDIGEYDVKVYETNYQYNLDVASASNLLIYDVMRVSGTSSPTFVSFTQSDNDTWVYFSDNGA